MEQNPLVGAGGGALDPPAPAMVDGAQAEAAVEGAIVMEPHRVERDAPDPPAMVDGALAEAAGDDGLVEAVGNGAQDEAVGDGALAEDVGNGAQAEAIELGAPAPANPKSRYVHPICYDDTVVASLILSDPPMGEGHVYCMEEGPVTVEGPAIQVEEPVRPLPYLGRQSWSIVYSGEGCVSRGEKNHRFWRHAMRDFGGAPELLLIKNKRAPHPVLTTTAKSTAPNSQLEELIETVSGATESSSKSQMVSGITGSKSGVSKDASNKKKKNRDKKKRKREGQRPQSHSAPQLSPPIESTLKDIENTTATVGESGLSPATESTLKDNENTTATVGESGPSYPLLPYKGKELAPCSDTPAHASMQGPNAKPIDFSSLRDEFCPTRIIRFMGKKYRILLQDRNGPCSLIAISNYLILKGRMTLPNLMEVCFESVAELVYVEVFKNMKDEGYAEAVAVLEQSAKGLDIDILFLSVDGFEDTPQYRIFTTLGIPLYHSCVLNLDLEEDASTFSAIEGRSFDQLHLDHHKHISLIQEVGPSYVMSGTKNTQFDRIDRFLKVANRQTTDYGFSTLKKNMNNGDLFVFFWSNHFTIVLKENGTLYSLLTDVEHQNSKFAWQVFDNLNARGELLEEVLISNLGKDLDVRTAPKVPRKTPVTPIPSVSIGSTSKSVEKAPLSRGHFKAQFASFFTGSEDEKFENKFLEFLRRYKQNDIVYYVPIITAMKQMGCQEMFVFYEHIDAVDPEFARSLCMCYERVRNNLSHALQTFIREDLGDPDFHCEHLSVRICDMPKPERALTNLLIKLSTNHMNGRSYNGKFTLDQILVNDKLEVDIAAPFCSETTPKTRQLDFVKVGNDFLSEYAVRGQLPGFFLHLEKSLKVYIDNLRFGASMLQKFHNFITAHPALKASLVRLAVIDDIYTAHQSLTRNAKRLLQAILDCDMKDWRTPIMNPEVAPTAWSVHQVVYKHNINKGGAGNEEKGDVKESAEEKGDEDEEPYPPTLEAGMIYLRHVRWHGARGAMDDMGAQQLKKLSDLDLLNAHVFDDVLPTILEQLVLYAEDFFEEYGQEAYDELSRWIDEIIENYRLPEFPS